MKTKTPDTKSTNKKPEETHLTFSDIQLYINGPMSTIDTQRAGHHIMHCPRCEAIWEQSIRDFPVTPPPETYFSRLSSVMFF